MESKAASGLEKDVQEQSSEESNHANSAIEDGRRFEICSFKIIILILINYFLLFYQNYPVTI